MSNLSHVYALYNIRVHTHLYITYTLVYTYLYFTQLIDLPYSLPFSHIHPLAFARTFTHTYFLMHKVIFPHYHK